MADRQINQYIDLIDSDQDPPAPTSSYPKHQLNQYTSLIDSDQDLPPPTSSNSKYRTIPSHPSASAASSRRPISTICQHSISSRPSYEDILCFANMYFTCSLQNHYSCLKSFLENRGCNVLFIFGPSGCGKRLLVQSALSSNGIQYSFSSSSVRQTEEGELIHEDIFELISGAFKESSKTRQQVIIFTDFPIPHAQSGSQYIKKYKYFKENLYHLVANCSNYNKNIFILNSEIYSSFYLLQENTEHSLTKLHNLKFIKMEPYGKLQMTAILNHFLNSYPPYASATNTKQQLEEVVLEANGDARRGLHLLYQRKLKQYLPQNACLGSKRKQKAKGEREQKVSVFHMLGKFLYGKRYNIYYNPNGAKKNNEISSYYSSDELKKLNPRFYFSPVNLYQRSRMSLAIFIDLLHENFINRYNDISDICLIQSIFRFYDSYIGDSLNPYLLVNEMQSIIVQLFTWGIILYNRHPKRDKQMYKIQRSQQQIVTTLRNTKITLLKAHYLRNIHATHYRIQDILHFAYLTNAKPQKYSYHFLHQKLIEVIYEGRISAVKGGESLDKQGRVVQQNQDQEIGRQDCNRVNQIGTTITKALSKRQQLIALALAQSSGSDIDSQHS